MQSSHTERAMTSPCSNSQQFWLQAAAKGLAERPKERRALDKALTLQVTQISATQDQVRPGILGLTIQSVHPGITCSCSLGQGPDAAGHPDLRNAGPGMHQGDWHLCLWRPLTWLRIQALHE